MRRSSLRAGLAAAAAAALGACGLGDAISGKPPPPCPSGVIVQDLSRLTVFRPGAGRDLTDVVYEARLPRLAVSCDYGSEGVEVQTVLTITGARGPANLDRRAPVSYFVAVLDPSSQILAKREFANVLEFPPNLDRGGITDELVQRIPLREGASAHDYMIAVGFQLTPDQLAFNRTSPPSGLLGPVPPRPEAPRIDIGPVDRRPIHEQVDDPYRRRPQ